MKQNKAGKRIALVRFITANKNNRFIETYHDILQRIPLGIVALYLCIKQETLSKLKKEKQFYIGQNCETSNIQLCKQNL